jgi:OmcA/MtrC family decaheme c-type cytochrome
MTWRVRGAAWCIAAALTMAFAAGCGDDDDDDGNGGGGGGGGGGTALGDNAAIQTGALKVDIQAVDIPEGGGAPTITFKVTDGTTAVTTLVQEIKNGVATPPTFPWTSVPRITLSKLDPEAGDYTSYYAATQTGRQWQREGEDTVNEPVQPSAGQATFDQAPTDATLDQRLTHQGDGVYRYTLAALPAGAQVDRAATHTAGLWLTRHTAAGEAATSSSTDTVNFIPAGGTAAKDEVVTLQACNRCHAPALNAHDQRLGVTVCQTCHSPQSTDPDTANTVDFKVMVHKIHMGGELPSAQGDGAPYTIVGFRPPTSTDPAAGVHVYDGSFINDVRDCALCHQGEDAARWNTRPSAAACTSCHDNVRFAEAGLPECGTAAAAPPALCNHIASQPATANCAGCHSPTDIQQRHQPISQVAQQFQYEIVNSTIDGSRNVTVDFRVNQNNQALALDATAADHPYNQTGSSLNVKLAWASEEYTNAPRPFGQPVNTQIVAAGNLVAASAVTPVPDQPNTYRVTIATPLPEGVANYSVFLDGHPVVGGEEVPVQNVLRDFAVAGGQAPARRAIVDVQKCNACHGYLSAHGNNRNSVVQVCAACHNSQATDGSQRGTDLAAAESIDLKRMIHEIHAAGIRSEEVTILGRNATPHTFPGELPNTTANCAICHATNTWNLPLNAAVFDTTLYGLANEVPATIAVCTACHDQTRFEAAPGLSACVSGAFNTEECLHGGGAAATDPAAANASCAACHGSGALGVSEVHPIQQ